MAVKNTLVDLNNFLFEQLERLNDENCDLEKEIPRAKSIVDIGDTIIKNAALALEASQFVSDCKNVEACGGLKRHIPAMLDTKED
jgi:hypothetical protein